MPKTIAKIQFKPPNNPELGIELLSIAELQKRAGGATVLTRPIRADFYRLLGVVAGSIKLMVDFEDYSVRPQHWLLVRPGQVLQYDFSSPWNGYLLVFRSESLFWPTGAKDSKALSLWTRLENMPNHMVLDDYQHQTMRRMVHQMELDTHLPEHTSILNEMLGLQLCSLLLRMSVWQMAGSSQDTTAMTYYDSFHRFRLKLEEDFASQHQVKYYSNKLGLSEKTLSRACQQFAGVSAKVYIAKRVALEAKRQLAHTSQAVQNIAIDLGFDEATNFVKFFKRETGYTPSVFRKRHSAALDGPYSQLGTLPKK